MSETQWWKYVQKVAGDASGSAIAERVRIDQSHLTRWKKGSNPDIAFVVKFARAYNRPPVEAIAAMGWITKEEAAIREVKVSLGDLTTVQLLTEAVKRVSAMPDQA